MAGIFVEKLLKEGGNDPIKLRDQRGGDVAQVYVQGRA